MSTLMDGAPPQTGGALVLASGGIDSSLCLALARREPGPVLALGLDYGQRNRIELQRLHQVAMALDCQAMVVTLDMSLWIPHGGLIGTNALRPDEGGSNYVPARNLVFLAIAASIAEARRIDRIYLGAGAADLQHPDCRPEFLNRFREMLQAGLHRPPTLRTPLLGLTKAQIVQAAIELRVPLHLTWSCHQPGPTPCGECAPCRLRRDTFSDLGLTDPGAPP